MEWGVRTLPRTRRAGVISDASVDFGEDVHADGERFEGEHCFDDVSGDASAVALTPITREAMRGPGSRDVFEHGDGRTDNGVTWTASAGTFAGNVWTVAERSGTYTITATSVDNPSVFVTTTTTSADR